MSSLIEYISQLSIYHTSLYTLGFLSGVVATAFLVILISSVLLLLEWRGSRHG